MTFEELNQVVKKSIANSSNRFDLWSKLLNGTNLKTICEIGVWKGDFAKYLLDNVKNVDEYIFIDPWRNLTSWNKPANRSNLEFEEIRREAFSKNEKYKDKIRELRMTTKEAAKELNIESIDFAYIDGDHTLRGITIDLNMVFIN